MNEQVKRNLDRFPSDFMFQLTEKEFVELQSLNEFKQEGRGGRRKLPLVFTECGVAMLSSVLNSPRAISVNISIMRIFVKRRSFLSLETNLANKVGKLEKTTTHLFKVVFERLDTLERGQPSLPKDRKKIGLSD
jgi:ORF6N domain